jgi:hypothetical protein
LPFDLPIEAVLLCWKAAIAGVCKAFDGSHANADELPWKGEGRQRTENLTKGVCRVARKCSNFSERLEECSVRKQENPYWAFFW